MTIEDLQTKLAAFRGTLTDQNIFRGNFSYINKYIQVFEVTSSNQKRKKDNSQKKQWNIIFIRYMDFSHLSNWIQLKNSLQNDIKISPFRPKTENDSSDNIFGIRLYKMTKNPELDIIKDILDFIFIQ